MRSCNARSSAMLLFFVTTTFHTVPEANYVVPLPAAGCSPARIGQAPRGKPPTSGRSDVSTGDQPALNCAQDARHQIVLVYLNQKSLRLRGGSSDPFPDATRSEDTDESDDEDEDEDEDEGEEEESSFEDDDEEESGEEAGGEDGEEDEDPEGPAGLDRVAGTAKAGTSHKTVGRAKTKKRGSRGGKKAQAAKAKRQAKPLDEEVEGEVTGVAAALAECLAASRYGGAMDEIAATGDGDPVLNYVKSVEKDAELDALKRESLYDRRGELLSVGPTFTSRLHCTAFPPSLLPEHASLLSLPPSSLLRAAPHNFSLTIRQAAAALPSKPVEVRAGDYQVGGHWRQALEVDATESLTLFSVNGTRVWGNWLLRMESHGTFYSTGFLYEGTGEVLRCGEWDIAPGLWDESLFGVEGGLWQWRSCALRAVDADALSARGFASVDAFHCHIGGLGGGEMCGQNAVLVRHDARAHLARCLLEFTGKEGGGGLACWDRASALAVNTTLRAHGYGVIVKGSPTVELRHSLVTLSAACLCALARKATILLNNTMLHGQNVWVDEEVPPQTSFEAPPNGCKDYLRGKCKRGSGCRFVHDLAWAEDVIAAHTKLLPLSE